MQKHNKKIKFVKKAFILFFCFLFTIVFVGCKKQTEQVETPTTQAYVDNVENNGNEQLYSFIIPKSIMGKYTAEEIVAKFNDSTTTIETITGNIPIKEAYTNIYANDDGTITYVFTDKQLETEKMYRHKLLSQLIADRMPFIKKIDVSDDHMEAVVYVTAFDGYSYKNNNVEYDVSESTATSMGRWQILNGVAPDKWHAKVTVKDYETGEIISEDSYPKE